jgi:predicted amidohydrolase YtcJ
MRIRLLCLLLAACAIAVAAADSIDLLLVNGRIHTMDSQSSTAAAMAIRDGRIVAIGSDQQLRALRPHAAKIVDLKGQAVIPGLIDSHTHALSWALGVVAQAIDATYPKMKSIADIAAAVKARASELPAGRPIIGSGWDETKLSEHRTPTRADLDAISPNHPVILGHISGHSVWVNSAALRMAQITVQTPNPAGGIIDKNVAGAPTVRPSGT